MVNDEVDDEDDTVLRDVHDDNVVEVECIDETDDCDMIIVSDEQRLIIHIDDDEDDIARLEAEIHIDEIDETLQLLIVTDVTLFHIEADDDELDMLDDVKLVNDERDANEQLLLDIQAIEVIL